MDIFLINIMLNIIPIPIVLRDNQHARRDHTSVCKSCVTLTNYEKINFPGNTRGTLRIECKGDSKSIMN